MTGVRVSTAEAKVIKLEILTVQNQARRRMRLRGTTAIQQVVAEAVGADAEVVAVDEDEDVAGADSEVRASSRTPVRLNTRKPRRSPRRNVSL